MKFNYQARTKGGEIKTGDIEASSREAAILLLQKYGFYVTVLEEGKEVSIFARKVSFFERISAKEKVLFSRQLSIMFGSKISLIEALRTLGSQTQSPNFKEKILKISEEVEGGTALSSAMAKYPKIFSSFYVAMIKAGEVSGKLSESLDYLAEHLEKEYHLVSKVRGAMAYPILILVVTISVLLLMGLVVIPRLSKTLVASGQALPFITKAVISFSDFLIHWGWLIFILAGVLIFFAGKYYKSKEGKKLFDEIFLKLPLFGSLLRMIYLLRFAENFATLIQGGIPISQSLEICGKIIGNSVYQEIVLLTQEEVRKGESVSQVLSRFPDQFPPIFTQMVLVGERTGAMDKTLMNLVGFYQKESERMIESLLAVLEPLFIVILGLIVGGLMAALLMPMYQISSF